MTEKEDKKTEVGNKQKVYDNHSGSYVREVPHGYTQDEIDRYTDPNSHDVQKIIKQKLKEADGFGKAKIVGLLILGIAGSLFVAKARGKLPSWVVKKLIG